MGRSIQMENIYTGEIKEAAIGFSWTTLFFGIFVPLLRGDILYFVLFLILAFLTIGFSWLVIPFMYNKMYIKNLLENGYIPADDVSKNELRMSGIFFKE